MSPSRAVILAAGNGNRMGRLTSDRPKAMLEVGGRSLIDRSLDALASYGIADVTIVVGYQQQRLRDHLGNGVRFVENARYRETNSLYSLSLAREQLTEGALIMNSDILVSRELLGRLVEAPVADAALIDTASTLADEEMKVKIWHGFVIDFSKELAPEDADGENVGILKFGPAGGQHLAHLLDRLVRTGHENAWAPLAFAELARERPLWAVPTGGVPWVEIDFPEDLERARQLVVPWVAALEVRTVSHAAVS